MKRTLQAIIILRFSTSSSLQLVSSLERCLDALPAATLPLHWSFPLHSLLKDSSARADGVIGRLRERTEDRLLPSGFSGAYHPLLTADELTNEMRWCAKNPWGEDTETVFTLSPGAQFPLSVDLLRNDARRIYEEMPPMLVSSEKGDRLFVIDRDTFRSLLVPKCELTDLKSTVAELKRLYRLEEHDTVAVVLDGLRIAPETLAEFLTSLSESQQRRKSFAVVRFEALAEHLPAVPMDLQSFVAQVAAVPADPCSRLYRAGAYRLKGRRRRKAEELTRRRLERLSPIDPDERENLLEKQTPAQPAPRTVIADMYGEVSLSEAELSVSFAQGRITGLRCGSNEVLAGQPMESRMAWQGRSVAFATIGAFSFEEDSCRGLRVAQRIDGASVTTSGQLTIDYFFENGQRDLQVAVTIGYPELAGVEWIDEYALLELPLFLVDRGDEIRVNGEYSDGERYEIVLKARPEKFQLFGNFFQFSSASGEIRLGYPAQDAAIPEVLPVCFRPIDDRLLFLVNPRGSYSPSPAASFAEMNEQFLFTIGADAKTSGDTSRKSLSTSDRR